MAGQIITFYSYKGGTGRTMLLANVAWILAAAGKRVLAIDWDLEAPGLHHYIAPFLADPRVAESLGLIDMVVELSTALATADAGDDDALTSSWFDQNISIPSYTQEVDWSFPGNGTLDVILAGQQNASYSVRVNSFDWKGFYENFGGGVFFEYFKEKVSGYDYVLIDSRTGVSDTSGICTVQMPDKVVVCFTANEQSILGASGIANSIQNQWGRVGNRQRSRILPVLCRVEQAEKLKLEAARARAQSLFAPSLAPMSTREQEAYWQRAQVVYWPWYAYEEVLAVFGDQKSYEGTVLSAAETMAELITEGAVSRLEQPPSPPQRDDVLRRVLRKVAADVPDIVAAGSARAWEQADFITEYLHGIDKAKIVSVDWPDLKQQASAWPTTPLILFFGKAGENDIEQQALADAASLAASDRKVIAVLLPGAGLSDLPRELASRPTIVFSDRVEREETLLSLQYALRSGSVVDIDDARFQELRLRRRFSMAVDEWQKADMDEAFLLRGRALEEAERWADSASASLSKLDQDFLAASRFQRDRGDLTRQLEETRKASDEVRARLDLAQSELTRAEQRLDDARKAEQVAQSGIQLAQEKFNQAERRLQEVSVRAKQLRRGFYVAAAAAAAVIFFAVPALLFVLSTTRDAERRATEYLAQTQQVAEEQKEKITERAEALRTSNMLAQASWAALQRSQPQLAVVLGAEALRRSNTAGEISAPAYTAVSLALRTLRGRALPASSGAISAIVVSGDGRRTAIASGAGDIRIFDVEAGTLLGSLPQAETAVTSMRFTASGSTIIAGTADGRLWLWDVLTARKQAEVAAGLSKASVADIQANPDGTSALVLWADGRAGILSISSLLSASSTGTQPLFDVGQAIDAASGQTRAAGTLQAAALSPDGRQIVGSTRNGGLIRFEVASRETLAIFTDKSTAFKQISYSPDGTQLAAVGEDGSLRIFDPTVIAPPRHAAAMAGVMEAQFSPNGAQLLTLASSGRLQVLALPILNATQNSVIQRGLFLARFDPQGLLVAGLAGGNTISVRCAEQLQSLYEFLGHDQPVTALAFIPSGRYMISGAQDGTSRVWELDLKTQGGACLAPGSASVVWTQPQGSAQPNLDLGQNVPGVVTSASGSGTLPLRTTASLLEEARIAVGRVATPEEIRKVLGDNGNAGSLGPPSAH
jgi:WD40 repeat protein/cellulose biosynthesis protein BcsQ